MKTIGLVSAQNRFFDLLDQVALGESFVISKRGKPTAVLSSVPVANRKGPKDIVTDFRKRHAKSFKKFSPAEIREMMHG